MGIRACPICGNEKLEWIGGGVNAIFDYLGSTVLSGFLFCSACGKNILPIEFESENDYKKFLSRLKRFSRQ